MPSTHTEGSSRRGMLIIGSGPSGAGKNSVFSQVISLQAGKLQESVSCTTREKRPGEVEGVDYFFVTREEFDELEAKGYFLEAAGQHDGKRYGTPLEPVEKLLDEGIDVLLVIEVNGARQAHEKMPGALTIFIMPAGDTLQEKSAQLQHQLHGRGREDKALIAERLRIAELEIAQSKDYQHVVVNAPGKLDEAVAHVNEIINEARRARGH